MTDQLLHWRCTYDIVFYPNEKEDEHRGTDVLEVIYFNKWIPEQIRKERSGKNHDPTNGRDASTVNLATFRRVINESLEVGNLNKSWGR